MFFISSFFIKVLGTYISEILLIDGVVDFLFCIKLNLKWIGDLYVRFEDIWKKI